MANSKLKIVGITACTTGIAHTFMAAECIEKAAKKRGYNINIEKQGKELRDPLSKKQIDESDVVIFAADVEVKNQERFDGKRILFVKTKDVLKNVEEILDKLKEKNIPIYKSNTDSQNVISSYSNTNTKERWNKSNLKGGLKHLMSGVRYMLPIVIVGGILVGIGFLIDIGVQSKGLGGTRGPAKILTTIGGWLLTKLTPMFLAGYIAKSMSGDKALVSGFVAGLVATGIFGNFNNLIPNFEVGGIDVYSGNPMMFSDILKSGFLGGIVGGFFAGFIVWLLDNLFFNLKGNFIVPKELIFIPIISALLSALFMIGVNFPLGYLMFYTKKGLTVLQENNLDVLLAILLGGCMAIDMGGPINKTASLVAIAHMVDNGSSIYMASVMAAGMIPPLVISFSTLIFKNQWTKEERNASKVNWILGAFYITEGAIPFAAKDPKKVIPIIVISSSIGAMLTCILGISISAPHGGVFIFPLLRSDLFSSVGISTAMSIIFYIASIIGSSIIGGVILGFTKKYYKNKNINKSKVRKGRA